MVESKELDDSLKLIAKSSMIVFIGIFLSKILAFVYRIIIVRYPGFGTDTYGIFVLAVIAINLITSIVSLGLPGGLLRYAAVYRGKKELDKIKHIFKFTAIITVITSVLFAIVVYYFSDFIAINIFHNSDLSYYLKWFSITIPLSVLASVYLSIMLAYEKANWYSFIRNILVNVVQVAVLVLLIYLGLKKNAIILSFVFGVIVMLITSYYVCRKKIPEVFNKYVLTKSDKRTVNINLINYSYPLILSGVVMFFFTSIDSFVIGYFLDVKMVGIYNAAIPLATLLSIVPSLFISLFFPLITKEYAVNNMSLIKETSKQVGKWIFLLNLPLLIIMILFPGAIINLFWGPDYLAATNSLRILSIGTFIFSIFLVSDNLISMAGRSKISLFNISLGALLNFFLDIILIKPYGITGVAFGTLIVYIVWSIITMLQARSLTKIIPLKMKMIPILLVSLIPTAILYLVKDMLKMNKIILVLLGIGFFIVYAILIIITGLLDENDKMIIKTIRKKINI